MRSPALALMGQVWWRYRWGLAACAAAWLMFAALGLLLPRGTWSPASPGDDPLRPVAWVVLVSFVPAFIHVLYAFSYLDEAQLEAREAGFPARNFILPVMTRTLVAWPMLQAAAVAAVTWVAWAGAVLRPVGLDVALVWPAVVTAALLAWLQALVWWPFPVRFLRCVVIALVLTVLAFVPVFGVALRLPPFVWAAAMAALIPVAYGVAVAGVARTRRGDIPEWTWPARLGRAVTARLPRRRAPFTSPLQAQAWLEWRLRGWGFPFTVGMVLLVWLPIVLTGAGERAIENLASADETPALVRAAGALTAPGVWLALLLALPPLLAGMSGIEMGGTRFIGQRPMAAALHPFVAVRPLTDGELVLAKLRTATRATLTGWVLVLASIALWLGLTGAGPVMAGAPILRPHGALQIGGGLVTGLAGLVLLTWIGLVSSLWVGLTGRAWLQTAVGFAAALVWIPLGLVGHWLAQHPDILASVLAALPSVARGAVVLKLLLAAWLARALWRRGLVAPRALVLSAVAWVVTVAVTVTLLGWVVPADAVSLPALALGVVLLLPLNRLAAAPLALAWNRHR